MNTAARSGLPGRSMRWAGEPGISAMPTPTKIPDPTPEEIRRLCAEIRSRWSPAEHDRRSQHPVGAVTAEIVPAETFYGESDRHG